MLKKPLKIKCYFNTPETSSLEDLGLDPSIDDAELREVFFFNIDIIKPYKEKEKWLTIIQVGGAQYITPLKYSELVSLLEKHI